MPRRTGGDALAGWLCMPAVLWLKAQLLRAEASLSVFGVSPANVGPGRDHLPQIAQLGVKWDTAWLIKQKLMEVMKQRNSIYKLGGDVQVDDAYQGDEKAGKRGRGAALTDET